MFSGPNCRLVNTWLQYSMVNTCVSHGMVTEIKVDSATVRGEGIGKKEGDRAH